MLRYYVLGFALIALAGVAGADEWDDALQVVLRAKSGPPAATRAARARLADAGPETLPRILTAMDPPEPVAANWLRTVFDDIVEREFGTQSPTSVQLEALRAFVRDPAHRGAPRRLAFEVVTRFDPDFERQLWPAMLADAEFRTEAVAFTIEQAQTAKAAGDQAAAIAAAKTAFQNARDAGQVQSAAALLRSLGEPADVIAHLGFVIDWYLLGPFDAPGYSGYETAFPPEKSGFDPDAVFTGQGGREIRWKRHQPADGLGQLDLIKAIASTKEAVGYAYAELNSEKEQAAQLRCGADDTCVVWLNGERVFGRFQWLNGTRLDRFVTPVNLKAGKNTLLVKICQGPQHKDPEVSNNWSLQLRFCDPAGAGVGLHSALPPAAE